MKYYAPTSLAQALELLENLSGEKNVLLAGGTDIVPKMKSNPARSGWYDKYDASATDFNMIYLGNLGLSYITCDEKGDLHIGALTTMSDILASSLADKVPVLKQALSQLAGLTIRNMATIGGNAMNASPAADSVPALIALGAVAVFAGKSGQRAEPVEQIFQGPGKTDIRPGEILTEFIIPKPAGKGSFEKLGRRKGETLSVVNGAAQADMSGTHCNCIRIAIGSVAPTPLRLEKIEKMLEGKDVTEELIAQAAEAVADEISPIDDIRGSAEYRKKVAKVVVKRVVAGACLQ
ncbi:FAD binding domain-containing protein [uncultured Flavonifractor sp.]|uniref:FAD binding domain-containing protein n=1 Tax=uncultured Flavonifractor sp. TaxID=1193534 RepID=UPI002611C682|nr:xanthine dehydrogenase family protein subunit M [uncultured Flavonifractor sp.]